MTSTCPSLVPGCAGGQRFDGENGVGWAALAEGTLGVTVYNRRSTRPTWGINTGYPWNLGCQELGTSYDLQTVLLHETLAPAALHPCDRAPPNRWARTTSNDHDARIAYVTVSIGNYTDEEATGADRVAFGYRHAMRRNQPEPGWAG